MVVAFSRQRGITLTEILLVATIVAASVVGIFMFSQKSSATAAVKREQSHIEAIVRTVESAFALQPNFSLLGADGAQYLHSKAGQSADLVFERDDDGSQALVSALGGEVSLRTARVDFPNGTPGQPHNGFVLTYSQVEPRQCIGLITATAPLATRIDVAPAGAMATASAATGLPASAVLVAARGAVETDRSVIASACKTDGSTRPNVYLSFAPARAIAGSPPPPPATAAQCNPVRETQVIACPEGQVGSVMQRRDGTCTGAGNSMVYTAWTTVEDTCVDEASAPPDLVATPPISSCEDITISDALACPSGQLGLRLRTRSFNTCTGVYSAWTTTSDSCHVPEQRTCFPSALHETGLACPSGMTGSWARTRGLYCDTPTSEPTTRADDDWTTYSNTCRGMPTCTPVRETRTTRCDAGFFGDFFAHQERFRACTGPNTTGGWSNWVIYEDLAHAPPQRTTGSCTACPPTVTETSFTWVPRSASCPPGQAGVNTWEAERLSTRQRSYSCPAGTLTLPSPSFTAWTSPADTGNTRSHVNTCGACPGPETETDTQTVSCPAGQVGSITQQRSRSRSYSCSGAGSWNTWSPWSAWVNVSNTCETPAPTCATPEAYYYHYSPDVFAAGVPAYSHWITHGHLEGRPSCWPAPTGCVPPAPEQETNVWSDTSRVDACPAGQVGSGITFRRDITDRRTRAASCPTPYGAPVWGGWSSWVRVNEGPWIETGRNCTSTPSCPDPSLTDRSFIMCNWDGSGWSCYSSGMGWVDVPCNVLPPPPPLPRCYCSGDYFDGVGFVNSFGSFPTRESCEAAWAGDAMRQCRAEISPFPTGSSCYHLVRNSWHSEPRRMYCSSI